MRTIPAGLKTDIEDASTAGLLGSLPPAIVEKDIHITDALRALSQIKLTHTAEQINRSKGDTRPARLDVATRLVFAGGTSLSKARRLVERMSEDIDIKVVLDPIPEGYALPKQQGDRKRLGDLHDEIERIIKHLGFTYSQPTHGTNPSIRDNRRYYHLAIAYDAAFRDASGALRPELKLELIHRPPLLPVEDLEMGYLFDDLVNSDKPLRFSMPCISIAETLAEKVLSMLRRCAWHWDGHQRGEFDPTLVRHIYDTWRIVQEQPGAIEPASQIFAALVEKDVAEFHGQHPGFDADPYQTMRDALSRMRTDEELRRNFQDRLMPLLFAETKPNFDQCFAEFSKTAERFLSMP
jgi:hypothetical protein